MSEPQYVVYCYDPLSKRYVVFVGSLWAFKRNHGDRQVNASYMLID